MKETQTKENKKAVVLLSGGLDSTTVLAIAKHMGFDLFSLSFSYGQRHRHELLSARKIADLFKVKSHMELSLDLKTIGGSALTDDREIPKQSAKKTADPHIPITYVPARNTIFLAHALSYAEVIESFDIFIGVNAIDYSGYPDCRPAFIRAFESLANLATKAGITQEGTFKVHAPLIQLTKAQIIQKGMEMGVDYSLTHSCYDPSPSGKACGECDSCELRKKGFREYGLPDPIEYMK